MVQPLVALSLLGDPLAGDSGFLARCLISQPPSTIGTRIHDGSTIDRFAIHSFTASVGNILDMPVPMDEVSGALNPRTLKLSHGARTLLIDYSNEVERSQAPGGAFDSITSHASKSAEHAARIAGVLTLLTDMSADEVAEEIMADGIALARYYLGEALRLHGNAQISLDTANAEKLRQWMLSSSWGRDTITVRDVVGRGPSRLREAEVAKKAIRTLAASGWLIPHEGGAHSADGARAREGWRIVRG